MKIVLDTNCLVNVIMPGSYNNDIWQAFRASSRMDVVRSFEKQFILLLYYCLY